jgi:hypothetical protein
MNGKYQVSEDGPRFRRLGVFWALPCLEQYADAYIQRIVLLKTLWCRIHDIDMVNM